MGIYDVDPPQQCYNVAVSFFRLEVREIHKSQELKLIIYSALLVLQSDLIQLK